MLRFAVKLFHEGAPLLSRLSDETYAPLLKAVRHLSGEAEALRGFVRFSDIGGVLVGEIEPKNRILPVLRAHFCERCHDEKLFLFDRVHHEALLYADGVSRIVPLDRFEMQQPDEAESAYRRLWKRFYETISIKERENYRLQRSNLPKRYRAVMTEFWEELTPPDTAAAVPARAVPDATPVPATRRSPLPPAAE